MKKNRKHASVSKEFLDKVALKIAVDGYVAVAKRDNMAAKTRNAYYALASDGLLTVNFESGSSITFGESECGIITEHPYLSPYVKEACHYVKLGHQMSLNQRQETLHPQKSGWFTLMKIWLKGKDVPT